MAILEGLVLEGVEEGEYELIALRCASKGRTRARCARCCARCKKQKLLRRKPSKKRSSSKKGGAISSARSVISKVVSTVKDTASDIATAASNAISGKRHRQRRIELLRFEQPVDVRACGPATPGRSTCTVTNNPRSHSSPGHLRAGAAFDVTRTRRRMATRTVAGGPSAASDHRTRAAQDRPRQGSRTVLALRNTTRP